MSTFDIEQALGLPVGSGTPPPPHAFSNFHQVVPPPKDKSAILWRYLSLSKLASLIADNKLYFPRADTFKDIYEGSVTHHMVTALKKQFQNNPHVVSEVSNIRRKLKESTFVSCWRMGPESEAMWRLYCGEKEGIAITAIYKDVENSLPDNSFHMAPVRYIDYQTQPFPQDNMLFPFFHKRLAFIHESEVRIVKIAWDQLESGADVKEREQRAVLRASRGMGILIDWDVRNIVRNIFLHPDAPDWYFDVVKRVVCKFLPAIEKKVVWSSMRGDPLY